jgi:hypothetical protein
MNDRALGEARIEYMKGESKDFDGVLLGYCGKMQLLRPSVGWASLGTSYIDSVKNKSTGASTGHWGQIFNRYI